MNYKTIEDIKEIKGKRVLLRVDFNVPFNNGKISDDLRIKKALTTIKYLKDKKAKIIICSHMGKINHNDKTLREKDKKNNNMILVYEKLKELVNGDVFFLSSFDKEILNKRKKELKEGQILLLQNTRYIEEETKNGEEFSKNLANLIDVFVLDAFGSMHRKHSSTYGVGEILKKEKRQRVLGFLVVDEIKALNKCIFTPKKPFVAIIGGKKVSDKIEIIRGLLKEGDYILIGGAMAYTFLKAKNIDVGNSLIEKDKVEVARKLLKEAGKKIILPLDHVISNDIKEPSKIEFSTSASIKEGFQGADIGQKTIKYYNFIIKKANTIFWNGPLGVFEKSCFEKGTKKIGKAIIKNKKAFKVVGGGDSAYASYKFKLDKKMSHISTGGGASLKLIEKRGNLDSLQIISKKGDIDE